MRVTPYAIPNNYAPIDDGRLTKHVSLPTVPGVTITSDRSETTPTLPMINIPKQTRIVTGAALEVAMDRRLDIIARRITSYRNGEVAAVYL